MTLRLFKTHHIIFLARRGDFGGRLWGFFVHECFKGQKTFKNNKTLRKLFIFSSCLNCVVFDTNHGGFTHFSTAVSPFKSAGSGDSSCWRVCTQKRKYLCWKSNNSPQTWFSFDSEITITGGGHWTDTLFPQKPLATISLGTKDLFFVWSQTEK